jgi:hypothetical protein
LTFTRAGLLLGAAAAQWAVITIISIVWWRRNSRIRVTEVMLLFSTLLFAGVWYKVAPTTVAAPTEQTRMCSTIQENTSAADVKKLLGQPSNIVGEEEMRGPGAEVWTYESTRCAVHLLNDNVDYVD